VALDAALPAVPRSSKPRPAALLRGLTARVGLTAVVLASFAVRVVASAAHPVPRLFPDEYLYTEMARSLGGGHLPAIRGASAHFPALLAPLLAAPLQALASPETAYRLTQAENALLMSLAAVPVYLIARRLSLPSRHALLCAVFAVAIPDLVFSAYTVADPAAYPLVLAAFVTGLAALERPRKRTQLLFLAFAGLATLDRVQYVVVPVVFFAAAAVVDRRRMLASQRLPLLICAVPAVGVLVIGASRVLGYYSNVTNLHVGGGVLRWAAGGLFLLAYASGIVLVPGALVALARPRNRAELAFSALTVGMTLAFLFEASLYAANGSARFHERYLFTLLPLVPLAFGVYAKHGFPARRAVLAIAACLIVLVARIPLSGYIEGLGRDDSPFLNGLYRLQPALSTAAASLLVAAVATLLLLFAIAVSRRGGGAAAALLVATGVLALSSAGAVSLDANEAQAVERQLVPTPSSWVDDAHVGPVTLVQTEGAQQAAALEQLYWNRSITNELLLGKEALPTDAYVAPRLHTTADGHIVGVDGAVLFQSWGATATFQNAQEIEHAKTWALWVPQGAPQLSLLENGRYFDGWLASKGTLAVWPDATGRVRGTLRFALTLPRHRRTGVTVQFGRHHYRIRPGRVTAIEYTIDKAGPLTLRFKASSGHWLQDFRHVSVQSTAPTFTRAPGAQPAATAPV